MKSEVFLEFEGSLIENWPFFLEMLIISKYFLEGSVTSSARSAITTPMAPSARSAARMSRARSSPPWARPTIRGASPAAVAADPFPQAGLNFSVENV